MNTATSRKRLEAHNEIRAVKQRAQHLEKQLTLPGTTLWMRLRIWVQLIGLYFRYDQLHEFIKK